MQAMIFAAGLGTRLKKETSDKPKALVKIGEKSLLQITIEKLVKSGATEIVINVHHFAELITEFLNKNDFGIPVGVSDESEKLLDTGGGLKKAESFFNKDEPLLIYNVDILSDLDLKKLLKAHKESGALATLVVRNRQTSRYFKFDETGRLTGWINKSTGEKKVSIPGIFESSTARAFSGIHVLQPEIFSYMPPENVFSITDLYLKLAKDHLIRSFEDTSELWMDVGKPDELRKARNLTPGDLLS